MVLAVRSLKHSRLLIPALIRIARLYSLPSYRRLEVIETADLSYDPFYKDECAKQHLYAYPETMELYLKVKQIEEKAEYIHIIGAIISDLTAKIVEKAERKFKEESAQSTNESWVIDQQNIIYSKTIASTIVSLLLSKTKRKSIIFRGCKSGACIHCRDNFLIPQFHERVQTDFLIFGENIFAEGTRDFLDMVKEFVEAEFNDENNLIAVAKIESLRSEYVRTINLLRTSIKKLIVDIENYLPLGGKCSICDHPIEIESAPV
jgi:hypothetical protein